MTKNRLLELQETLRAIVAELRKECPNGESIKRTTGSCTLYEAQLAIGQALIALGREINYHEVCEAELISPEMAKAQI